MKHKLTISTLLLLALFSALAPAALASTTWYVNGVSGSDSNSCKSPTTACKTIGHAVSLATSGDTIMVAAATYGGNLTISKSLSFIGSSAQTTIIDGGGVNRVVTISNNAAQVTLSQLTIRHGYALGQNGGGIYNGGTLTINHCVISGNSAVSSGVPFAKGGYGGGIDAGGPTTISNTTISGNSGAVSGGGIYSGGTLTINNTTVSGNSAFGNCGSDCLTKGLGGGIVAGGPTTINNSSISGNSAHNHPVGGGIYVSLNVSATIQNSIVANNIGGGNCGGTMMSHGYNMSSDGTCNFHNSGDRNNTNPMLGTLGNYGGPTQTIPLLTGSPAIDAGNPSGCTDGSGHLLTTDQRGMPRPDKGDTGRCDMGAYETQN